LGQNDIQISSVNSEIPQPIRMVVVALSFFCSQAESTPARRNLCGVCRITGSSTAMAAPLRNKGIKIQGQDKYGKYLD
jgi:hypothetical protein